MFRAAAAQTSPATRSGLGGLAACVFFPEGRSRRADQQIDVFTVAADWLPLNGEAAAFFSGERLTRGAIRECGGEQGWDLGFNHLRSVAG